MSLIVLRALSLEKLVTVAHPPVPGFRGFGKRWGFEKRSAQMAERCRILDQISESWILRFATSPEPWIWEQISGNYKGGST